MNRCDYCLENLSAYLDRELSEHEMKAIEMHLEQCDSCTLEFNILKTIVSTCSELLEELPEGYSSSLHTKLEKAKEEKIKNDKRTRIRMFSQIAAGFIIVITLGIVVRTGFFDNRMMMMKNESTSDAAPMAISAGRSEQRVTSAATPSDSLKMQKSFEASDISISEDESKTDLDKTENYDSGFVENKDNEDIGVTAFFAEDVSKMQSSYVRDEDYDTVVTITVEDVGSAIESIMAIDEKFTQSDVNNKVQLEDSIYAYRGGTRNDPVELKLIYVETDIWQSFLAEMELIFPNIQIDSVPSQEEQQYVRIIIQKEK
jgi:hypothetical protein